MTDVDFGMLTEEETSDLALKALGELKLDQRVKVVLAAFQGIDREELASQLSDDERAP